MDAIKKIEILNKVDTFLRSKGAPPTPVNVVYALDAIGALMEPIPMQLIPIGDSLAEYARNEASKELQEQAKQPAQLVQSTEVELVGTECVVFVGDKVLTSQSAQPVVAVEGGEE